MANVNRQIERGLIQGRALILKQLEDVALQVAADQDVNMVLEKSAVIIMAPDFDKTDEAIAILNQVMPDLPTAEETSE